MTPSPRTPIIYCAAIAALALAVRLLGYDELLSVESLVRHRAALMDLVSRDYALSVALFAVVFIATVSAGLPGATPLTVCGGLLFGAIGALYSVAAATCGAIIAFTVSRRLAGRWLQERFAERLANFNRDFDENGAWYVLAIRMTPLFPSFLVNLLAGLSTLPARSFLLITALGIIPNSLAYTYAGRRLALAETPRDLLSPETMLALALIALAALVPPAVRKLAHRRGTRTSSQPD
ncbi:MAG TPA: TVP38/TMEM64 family protein [Spirochaetota bacterium]|nr:TVP38/TMEM64 family protein [Spirochaetota bacterium]HNT13063.1 TVP38/TMEM64 family protein [Spirochaetota bacterium]